MGPDRRTTNGRDRAANLVKMLAVGVIVSGSPAWVASISGCGGGACTGSCIDILVVEFAEPLSDAYSMKMHTSLGTYAVECLDADDSWGGTGEYSGPGIDDVSCTRRRVDIDLHARTVERLDAPVFVEVRTHGRSQIAGPLRVEREPEPEPGCAAECGSAVIRVPPLGEGRLRSSASPRP